jgi:hypothetical protein
MIALLSRALNFIIIYRINFLDFNYTITKVTIALMIR